MMDSTDYKSKCKALKQRMKFLLYENECFTEELRRAQSKLLKVCRDKSFLLDRLLQYERVDESSSDSDATLGSETESENGSFIGPPRKKKKTFVSPMLPYSGDQQSLVTSVNTTVKPRKNYPPKRTKPKKTDNSIENDTTASTISSMSGVSSSVTVTGKRSGSGTKLEDDSSSDQLFGHMTRAELERHLDDTRAPETMFDLGKISSTVPQDIFSEGSSDSDDD